MAGLPGKSIFKNLATTRSKLPIQKSQEMSMKNGFFLTCLIVFLSVSSVSLPQVYATERKGLSNGQTIYVPAYSHIYSGNRERPFLLTITLSIRNIDPEHQIKITRVDYYETQGMLLKKYVTKPVSLNPLESLRYVVPEKDKSGGSGANFLVEWKSEKYLNAPIVEAIMISTKGQQGVSFTSRGKSIISRQE
jgi:hypothetical protein